MRIVSTLISIQRLIFSSEEETSKWFRAWTGNPKADSSQYLIFGVKDKPSSLIGLSAKSNEQFEKIDPEKITGYLLELFSSEIRWEQATVKVDEMAFGVFRILPANV